MSRYSCILLVCGGLATFAGPALGQQAALESNASGVTVAVDVANRYVFRGVRQNSNGVVTWPQVGAAAGVLSKKGPVERLAITGGFWNSLHTGDTGSGGPAERPWYESRLSGGLIVEFGGNVSIATSYTTYVSPNDLFSTAKELGVRVAFDDRARLRGAALQPYALVAFELGADTGRGQLDGGLHAGRYLELGASPGYVIGRARLTVPIKVGLSLHDYYELGDRDYRFGFASLGGAVSVPVGGTTPVGQWDVRAGIEVYRFGTTTRLFNGNDRVDTVASVGVAIQLD